MCGGMGTIEVMLNRLTCIPSFTEMMLLETLVTSYGPFHFLYFLGIRVLCRMVG